MPRPMEARERARTRRHRGEGQCIHLRCRTQHSLAEDQDRRRYGAGAAAAAQTIARGTSGELIGKNAATVITSVFRLCSVGDPEPSVDNRCKAVVDEAMDVSSNQNPVTGAIVNAPVLAGQMRCIKRFLDLRTRHCATPPTSFCDAYTERR